VAIGVGLLAEEHVIEVAVGVVELAGEPELDRIRQGPADPATREHAHAVVETEGDLALELVARLLGLDDDRAADCVAPVEPPLRALEHLDLLDVEQVLVELRRIDLLYAVDDDRDRGFGVARLGDAANDDERVARVLRRDQRDVRGQVDEVLRLEDARVLDRVRRECGDRGRSVLQLVRAPQAGDQDRVAARLLAGGGLLLVRILRGGRKGDGERRQRDCGTSQSARSDPCHRVLPQNDLLFSGGEYRETRRKGIVATYLSRLAIIRPQTDSALAISTAAAAPLAPARDTARGKAARANAVGSARSRKLVSARPRATSNASSGA